MNYYRRFPGDYLRDTRRLNLLQHGAYTLLLDELYSTEERIPTADDAIRICQAVTEEEKWAVNTVLEKFFKKTRTGFTNPRYEEELVYTKEKSNKASESAKKRWDGNTDAMRTHTERNAIPDSIFQTPEPEEPNTQTHAASAAVSVKPEVLLAAYDQKRGELPEVRATSPQRLSKCRQRLLSHKASLQKFLVDFERSVERASGIRWPTWKPTFDWFVANDTNYLKVLEGNYDRWGEENGTRQAATGGVTRAEQRLAEAQRQSESVFGRASKLVGTLCGDLPGRSPGAIGHSFPQYLEAPAIEAGSSARSALDSGKAITGIPPKTGTRL